MDTPTLVLSRPLQKPPYVGLFLEPAIPPQADLEDDDDLVDDDAL
jgi:hypothetical protein